MTSASRFAVTCTRNGRRARCGGQLPPGESGLVENPAFGEVRLDDLVPAAQRVLDCNQVHGRQLRRVALRDGRVADPEEVFRENFLTRIAVQELQVRVGDRARAVTLRHFVNNSYREIRPKTDLRYDRYERNLRVLRPDCVYL